MGRGGDANSDEAAALSENAETARNEADGSSSDDSEAEAEEAEAEAEEEDCAIAVWVCNCARVRECVRNGYVRSARRGGLPESEAGDEGEGGGGGKAKVWKLEGKRGGETSE